MAKPSRPKKPLVRSRPGGAKNQKPQPLTGWGTITIWAISLGALLLAIYGIFFITPLTDEQQYYQQVDRIVTNIEAQSAQALDFIETDDPKEGELDPVGKLLLAFIEAPIKFSAVDVPDSRIEVQNQVMELANGCMLRLTNSGPLSGYLSTYIYLSDELLRSCIDDYKLIRVYIDILEKEN